MDFLSNPLQAPLSGLLELQKALKDLDEVADAFRDWSGDPGLSPIEVLIGKVPAGSRQRELMEGLAGLLRDQGGDGAEEISFLGTEGSSHRLPGPGSPARPESAQALEPDEKSSTVGQRFRVVRHHAEGGLGSVVVAVDRELNREVALKRILDRHADDRGRRARFLIEAEITGGLEHPGIVPVYSLGHSDDGRPFYAMRLVRGETFEEAIARFHDEMSPRAQPGAWGLELRRLLRRFIDVCNAIEYAHGRGILHRDLKPSNVMLGKHGETLVVDWGLAKPIAELAFNDEEEGPLLPSSGGGLTLPGSAVGTPSFMSPEQALGDPGTIGPASDVYSLGATLYCLLVGKPAFGSDDPKPTIREAREGGFPPPRRANRMVPPPLEAICLKAMDNEPQGRYESARTLADDIERWMADEPVSAYREPRLDRARRWLRRRRSVVTAGSAALLVAMLGLGVVLAVQSRANEQLRRANEREKWINLGLKEASDRANTSNDDLLAANSRVASINRELRAANDRERARFDLALEAIRHFHSGVSNDLLLKEAEFAGLRANLLHDAIDFYGKLRRQLEGHPDRSSREAIARVFGQIADLEATVGTAGEAMAACQAALRFRRDLVRDLPGDLRAKVDLASSLISLGIGLRDFDRFEAALEPLREARGVLEEVGRLGAPDPRARILLADCHHEIGGIFSRISNEAESLAAYDRSSRIRSELALAEPSSNSLRSSLAATYQAKGFVEIQGGKLREAFDSLNHAGEILEKLTANDPSNARYWSDLASVLKDIGDLYLVDGRIEEAVGPQERGLAIRERLSAALPGSVGHRTAISHSLLSLGRIYSASGRRAGAIAVLTRSAALQESLPESPIGLFNLACTRIELASSLGNAEGIVEAGRATRAFRRAIEVGFGDEGAIRRMVRSYPILDFDPDFRLLILDLSFPRNPIAP